MEAMPMEVNTNCNSTTSIPGVDLATHAVNGNQRHCFGDTTPGQFPFSSKPSILLHIFSSYGLDSQHLACLEATCSFFRLPSNLDPSHPELNIVEVAALDLCQKRAAFKLMGLEEKVSFKQRCGGSWKLVLRFLMAGEVCCRREKCQAISGPGHSIVITTSGTVYSFGNNSSGELGHGNIENQNKPRLIRHLRGVRIVQAATGAQRTMLVSDAGRVYAIGKNTFVDWSAQTGPKSEKYFMIPKLVESLKDIFVVQVSIGSYLTAVLSSEGRVYTFCWGTDARLGHDSDPNDNEPRLLSGPWEDNPIVQIAAGNCYLLTLAFQPSGMSVYSLGCGQGGKLGHGTARDADEEHPRLIEHFQVLNLKPVCIAAGALHAAALGQDGRVCTWGWGNHGCLGHGDENFSSVPKIVEALSMVKAVHLATGYYSTFVVSEDGDVYSFGCNHFSNLGQIGQANQLVLKPELATGIKQAIKNEKIVQISSSNSCSPFASWSIHTLLLTDAGRLYAFGSGQSGQLGVQLAESATTRESPELVNVDLS